MMWLVNGCGGSPTPPHSSAATPHSGHSAVSTKMSTTNSTASEEDSFRDSAAWHFLTPQCVRRRDGAWCWGPGAPARKPELDGVVAIARAHNEYYLLANGMVRVSAKPIAHPREEETPYDSLPEDSLGKLPKIVQVTSDGVTGALALRGQDGSVWSLVEYHRIGGADPLDRLVNVTLPEGASVLPAGTATDAISVTGKALWWDALKDRSTGTVRYTEQPEPLVRGSCGLKYCCYVAKSGRVYCSGHNSEYQLGDGTQRDSRELVQVRGLPPARMVFAGLHATYAVLDDGSVWWWGQRDVGVPNFAAGPQKTAKRLEGLSDVAEVTSRWDFMCARLRNDAIVCRGRNNEGQLGDATTTSREQPKALEFRTP
jgi:hypothetical protein